MRTALVRISSREGSGSGPEEQTYRDEATALVVEPLGSTIHTNRLENSNDMHQGETRSSDAQPTALSIFRIDTPVPAKQTVGLSWARSRRAR